MKDYSILSLAFIGDAYYNLVVKQYAIDVEVKPDNLQKVAAKYCSAKFQANAIKRLLEENFLTEEEEKLYKRGRNAKSHGAPKNTDILTYKTSTGFEAVWGYHYLNHNEERLMELWEKVRTFEDEEYGTI